MAKSYRITADVEVPADGGDGMIVTDGGRFGGYGLYLLQGQAGIYLQPARSRALPLGRSDALSPGKHEIVFDFTYDGPGFGKGGTGVLKLDGKEVANRRSPTRSRSCSLSTRPSTSGLTPAPASTTGTTRCRSASAARSPS